MKVGIPKEIKQGESRVGMTPAGVSEFVKRGHTVYVQHTAGDGSGFPDKEYEEAGASILPTMEEVYAASDMIVKVKEPIAPEYPLIRKGQIVFTYFHGMTDFYGGWSFLRTILYHYAVGKGLAVSADEVIRLAPDTSMAELERTDPYRHFVEEGPKAEMPAAFAIPEEVYPPEDARCTSYEVRCPLKDFLAAAKAQHTSAAAFLSLTAARALDSLYEVGDRPILVMLPADMRKFYQTATVMNFSDATFLRYDEELKALPPEEQGAALKEQLKSQLNKAHFAPLLAEKVAAIDGFAGSGTDIFQWNQRLAEPPQGPAPFTIPLTYPGRLDLPAGYQTLVKHIANMLYFRGGGSFGILGLTYGDTVYLSSSQRFESPAIMQELQKKLNEAGIPATFHELPFYQGNQLITNKLQQV